MPGARYVEVLRLPGTARPLFAALLGRIPDSIAALAIVVLLHERSGSYSVAGAAAAAFGIGTGVSAPLAGRALDRVGQRRVLPLLSIAFSAALAALVFAPADLTPAWAWGLAALAGLTRPPLDSALRACWPRLVDRERLDAAYALESTLQELVWIAGPLLLSALLALRTPELPLLACGALSLAGTLSYAASPRLPTGTASNHRLAGAVASSRLRVLLAAAALYGVAIGILMVALAAFAGRTGSPAGVGVLVAVWGLGSLAGGVAYGSRAWRAPVERRAAVALAGFGAALLLLALGSSYTALALLMVPLGLPLSPWLGALSASVQRAVRPEVATEAFTWTFAAVTAGAAAGNGLGGSLVEQGGTRPAFLCAGALALCGAALASR